MTKDSSTQDQQALATMIDHTILKPEATTAEVLRFCEEAKTHGFHSVCVNAVYVPTVAAALNGTEVRTCAVVGFPLGATSPAAKAAEARQAVLDGAEEIDMVIAIGALKDGRLDHVRADIQAVRDAGPGVVLKVIIETCLLTEGEKRQACQIAQKVGADFVKTSTGFSKAGATVEDITLMRAVVGPELGVKASGGVRSFETAQVMIAAGATRIGTSSGIQIIAGEAAAGPASY